MKKTLLLLSGCISASVIMAQASNYPNGSTVDDFTVTDTQGQVHNLNAYAAAGKYVLLDFFFYDCGPCQINAPHYSQLYQTYGCNGGDLICIEINNGMDSDALTEAFSEDFAPGYAHPPAVGSGGGDALTTTFGVGAFPTFCLIGPDKVMINQDIWPLSSGMQTFVNAFPPNSGITAMACATAIQEESATRTFSVLPTVTDRYVTVSYDGSGARTMELDVFDLTGRSMLRSTLRMGIMHTLDLGALPAGQYFVKLMADGMLENTRRIAVVR